MAKTGEFVKTIAIGKKNTDRYVRWSKHQFLIPWVENIQRLQEEAVSPEEVREYQTVLENINEIIMQKAFLLRGIYQRNHLNKKLD